MKAIKDFLTGTAKKVTVQFLTENSLVTPDDKGFVSIAQVRKALGAMSDEDLINLAVEFGYDESATPADTFIQDLGFTPDERGTFTAKDGTVINVVNAIYKNRSSSGLSTVFEFSKGFIIVKSAKILQFAKSGGMTAGKRYPIQADTILATPELPGYFNGKALESGFSGIDALYLAKADKNSDLKIALKDMRDQGATEEEIASMLFNARQQKLVSLV